LDPEVAFHMNDITLNSSIGLGENGAIWLVLWAVGILHSRPVFWNDSVCSGESSFSIHWIYIFLFSINQLKQLKMFHDETLLSFFRRPSYTPDGSLLIVPGKYSSYDFETRKIFSFWYLAGSLIKWWKGNVPRVTCWHNPLKGFQGCTFNGFYIFLFLQLVG
jgi:hypothetical protein